LLTKKYELRDEAITHGVFFYADSFKRILSTVGHEGPTTNGQ
jgi:hypothetical protein